MSTTSSNTRAILASQIGCNAEAGDELLRIVATRSTRNLVSLGELGAACDFALAAVD
ncbi:MAG: hypothetical protein GY811_20185 [Myxococcales bacterium]|nr:hypothetical protein [Myxococcales bacterium]